MKEKKREKPKLSFRETLRVAWRPYLRLAKYVAPYKGRFFAGIACGVIFGALSGLLPLIIAKTTAFVFGSSMPLGKSGWRDARLMATGPHIDSVAGICLAIPAVMLLRSAFDYANAYLMNWVANKVVTDLRVQLFEKILSQSMEYFNRMRAGFLMSRITHDTKGMQVALTQVSSDIFKQPIQILGGLTVLLVMDWKFTLMTLVLFPTVLAPLRLYGKKAREAVKREQENAAGMTVTMTETFAGIRVIKSFTQEEHQTKTFRKNNERHFTNSMKLIKAQQATGPLIETIAAIGVGVALAYVYFMGISAGRFFGLVSGIFMLYNPMKSLSRLHIVMQRSVVGMNEAFATFDAEPAVQDAKDAIELERCEGQIDFEHVTFRYGTGVSDALSDVTLRMERGRSYALVGASGAGKSTILSMILRLYDPASGTIKIDGHDVRRISQKSLRRQIGLVTQETFLFHDTILNNIRFGRLKATEEEVEAAARTAYAHDFIMAQPNGYHTLVGDKGMMLSGGQQQRLAIARAVLKNAPILLLDEATSALDSESEQQIQLALERLAQGRTVIAIAHRLSTILSADQIIVMEHGRVIEVGTHTELLSNSSYYRRLYDLQFNRKSDEPSAATFQPALT